MFLQECASHEALTRAPPAGTSYAMQTFDCSMPLGFKAPVATPSFDAQTGTPPVGSLHNRDRTSAASDFCFCDAQWMLLPGESAPENPAGANATPCGVQMASPRVPEKKMKPAFRCRGERLVGQVKQELSKNKVLRQQILEKDAEVAIVLSKLLRSQVQCDRLLRQNAFLWKLLWPHGGRAGGGGGWGRM